MSPHVTAYFRQLGKRGTGASKRRDVDYAALSAAGVAARKKKRETLTATVVGEKKSEV